MNTTNVDTEKVVNVNGKLFLINGNTIEEVKTHTVNMEVKTGYLYCFSNPSMPSIIKCGMTDRTPPDRLKEANSSNT